MPKYKQVIEEMLEINKDTFASFKEIHDKFAQNPTEYREKFNELGQDTMRVIHKWENILCGKSESGKYGRFSTALSEKFWREIRSLFPLIDKVGELD